MIEERGVVERRTGDSISVRVTVAAECGECPLSENCYSTGKLLNIPVNRLQGCSPDELAAADRISFSIGRTSLLGVTGLLYGIPLLALIVGIFTGYFFFFADVSENLRSLYSFFSGFGLLLLSGVGLYLFDRGFARSLVYKVQKYGAGA